MKWYIVGKMLVFNRNNKNDVAVAVAAHIDDDGNCCWADDNCYHAHWYGMVDGSCFFD